MAMPSISDKMIRELLFATHNSGKAAEIARMLGNGFLLHTLKSLDIKIEVPETGTTLHENARLKSETICKATGLPCFADDTGLFVYALSGSPGVYSARYAGNDATDDKNMDLLLSKLENIENRAARFKTVICYTSREGSFFFEGTLEGKIAAIKSGNNGFGYDPIFIPQGYNQTLAQLLPDEKNAISHRAKAFSSLVNFLTQRAR